MTRPTQRLTELQAEAREPAAALAPGDLGVARSTRHSFARSMLRLAAAQRWTVTREVADLDRDGRGTIVLRVDMEDRAPVRLVAFSTVLDESKRTDRVIAETWDLTGALCGGDVDDARIGRLHQQVTQQELGRADDGTLVWGRANRSARFFDHVVDRLAAGHQPDRAVIGDDAYLMRSTAFYGNGKWGLVDFGSYDPGDPLAVPYRAQMLAAWLFREISFDLVEHCARQRSSDAVPLDTSWSRYFGLGNATGLGLVPYVINHPQVFDAWVAMRELPLANALETEWSSDSPEATRILELLERAETHFAERTTLSTAPYPTGPQLATQIAQIGTAARNHIERSQSSSDRTRLARWLHDEAAGLGDEIRAIVDSILVEIDDGLDTDIESLLACDERPQLDLAISCGRLLAMIHRSYRWIDRFDLADPAESARFWYLSADSQEPRRGWRDSDPGTSVEHPLDVARRIAALADALDGAEPERQVIDFLFDHPTLRWAVDRVLVGDGLIYGEAHVNPVSEHFLPLDLQRFQLAAYGMENFSPQSTDWLRVTLFAGAPRARDVEGGLDDDWCFAPKPEEAMS